MTIPENRTPMQSDDMAKLHPSTWEAQCAQLQSKLAEAESRASWAEMTKNRAIDETKALRARVATLEAALDSEHASVGHNIWRFWSDKACEITNRNTALRAAMSHALARLDASLFTNAEHQQAKDTLRAALDAKP